MARHGNRRPGVAPRLGGNYESRSKGATVILFKPARNLVSVPQHPAFVSFLNANRAAIEPIAKLGRRLERCEIEPDHAVIALIAIVELFTEEAP
jgi:hypothetical protein